MGGIHPTQKPVELCEYFIKTYTDEGAVVADICAGSGTTAVAALNTGRRFICFENAPAIYGPAASALSRHGWLWSVAGKECNYRSIFHHLRRPPVALLPKGLAGAAEHHYPTMSIDELCALPVADLAAPDSALFLWATFPQLPEALRLIREWGFTYKSVAFVWLKKNRKADSWFYGLGFWTRANAEVCLLATRATPSGRQPTSTSLLFRPSRPTAKSRTRPGTKLWLSWAICPVWSCSPGRPRPAGMCGATRYSPRSGTSGQIVPRKEAEYALCKCPQ